MDLPLGVTQDTLKLCKKVIANYAKEQAVDKLAVELLHLVYGKGGDYSEETLQKFASSYFGGGL